MSSRCDSNSLSTFLGSFLDGCNAFCRSRLDKTVVGLHGLVSGALQFEGHHGERKEGLRGL